MRLILIPQHQIWAMLNFRIPNIQGLPHGLLSLELDAGYFPWQVLPFLSNCLIQFNINPVEYSYLIMIWFGFHLYLLLYLYTLYIIYKSNQIKSWGFGIVLDSTKQPA